MKNTTHPNKETTLMNDQTFEILRKIRSHLWDAEYEMIIHRDDLHFIDSEAVRYLRRLLSVTATQITEHIHNENGWTTDEV